jgi:hypothetical protein
MMIGILHEHACLHLEIEWLRRGSDIVVHLLRPWNHNIEQVKWLDQIFFFVLIFNFLIIFRSPPPCLVMGSLIDALLIFFKLKSPSTLIPHQSLADACNIQSWQDTINCLNCFLYAVMGSIDCDDLNNVSYPYQGKKNVKLAVYI